LNLPALDSIEIPDKTHFKIGEVAKLLDLEPYVLRYWEKEFDVLEPSKTDSGQRAYQRDDIQLLATIRELLYTEMFTIDGARRQLDLAREGESSFLHPEADSDRGASGEVLEELEWENAQLREELEEAHDARLRLEADVERLEGELESAREANESEGGDEEELERWRSQAQGLEDEVARLRTQLAEAKSELDELERENEQLRDRSTDPEVIEALRGEVSELARVAESAGTASGS
jgi:DNA-binding transcriptional MerR regulator